MRAVKLAISFLFVLLTAIGWYRYAVNTAAGLSALSTALAGAERAAAGGLYEQAAECYRQAISLQPDAGLYKKLLETNTLLYGEDDSPRIYASYISDMRDAVRAYPKNPDFWSAIIEMQMGVERYNDAYDSVSEARSVGVRDERIEKRYRELIYMDRPGYRAYYSFNSGLNGYISASTDPENTKWIVIDEAGDNESAPFRYIGLINGDGMGVFQMDTDEFRLLDKALITRGIIGFHNITAAGAYDGAADYFPVKTGNGWTYMRPNGEAMQKTFEIAGSFTNGQAAVKADGQWGLADPAGEVWWLPNITDIKLGLTGNHIKGNVIIAREADKYGLYDKNFQRIGTFAADDMDIYLDGPIAYKDKGLWGFADHKGAIVVPPEYHMARSFSNGFAAVADASGLWGFINAEYDLAVGYKYGFAHYFTKDRTCLISLEQGKYQLLNFRFG